MASCFVESMPTLYKYDMTSQRNPIFIHKMAFQQFWLNLYVHCKYLKTWNRFCFSIVYLLTACNIFMSLGFTFIKAIFIKESITRLKRLNSYAVQWFVGFTMSKLFWESPNISAMLKNSKKCSGILRNA